VRRSEFMLIHENWFFNILFPLFPEKLPVPAIGGHFLGVLYHTDTE
jgi:hypothetical protein